MDAFEGRINDKSFIVNIEDMMKPFATKLSKFGFTPGGIFDKYDTNKNARLSVEELRDALKKYASMDLGDDEVDQLRNYFKQRFGSRYNE